MSIPVSKIIKTYIYYDNSSDYANRQTKRKRRIDMEESIDAKVSDLTPNHNRVNLKVKVVRIGETKEIPSRYGPSKKVTEAVVGDETGVITMSLWEDQIDGIHEGDVLVVNNGYISLVQGHMRLNVGKYGSKEVIDEDIGDVNEGLDMSEKEYEYNEYRRKRNYGGRGGYGRNRY